MLQSIRDRLIGWVLWVMVGIIVVPFAFWGVDAFHGGGGDPVVAKVGDQKITQSQFRAGYEQRYQQLQALLGENFHADQFDQNRFRAAVLQDMVQESLLRQYVRNAGYRASDAALFDYIRTIPAFQENGKFSAEAYRNRLALQGYTPERFETQLRDALVIEQMRAGILESAFVTDAGVVQAYRLINQERFLTYTLFETARYLNKAQVSDEQIQARYEQQKARYLTPERIKLAYVELSLSALPPAETPSAEMLKAIYEAEKTNRFTAPEERRARHILINFGSDKAVARHRVEALAKQIENGADFTALARANSDDTGSKAKGGDLGWMRRGQMLEKFEKTLFALNKGDVSEPVETEYGWHLIKLDDLHEARTRPFDDPDVKAQLLELYRNREAQRRFQEQSEKLEQLAFESPNSLANVAKSLGLTVQTNDWFGRKGGQGIAANQAVIEAAFSDDVLKNDENSRPLAVGESRIVVVRKAEYEPPRQRELSEVKDDVRTELKTEAARAQAELEATAVLSAVRQGRSLEQLAREKGLQVRSPGLIKRERADVDASILDTLFRMPRPTDGKASVEQVKLANGDVAVLALSAVQEPAWPALNQADDKLEPGKLRDATSGAEFSAYRDSIGKQIKIKIVAPPEAETPEG